MLEQKTIQEGIGLIKQYGPLEGIMIYMVILTILVIAWNLIQASQMKKATDPIEQMNEKIHKLELDLKDRVKYDWAEEQLIPKIDGLRVDVNKLAINVEVQSRSNELLAKALESLVTTINKHSDRLAALEK